MFSGCCIFGVIDLTCWHFMIQKIILYILHHNMENKCYHTSKPEIMKKKKTILTVWVINVHMNRDRTITIRKFQFIFRRVLYIQSSVKKGIQYEYDTKDLKMLTLRVSSVKNNDMAVEEGREGGREEMRCRKEMKLKKVVLSKQQRREKLQRKTTVGGFKCSCHSLASLIQQEKHNVG